MITLTHDEKLRMIAAMRQYGGGFVQALAECFTHADKNNLQRLLTAFPEYVENYCKMANIKHDEETAS